MIVHSKYGSLRAHQAQAIDEVERVAASGQRILVANITPGGGKTMFASIVAHEMIDRGLVDNVVVLCPRDALRVQMIGGFTDTSRSLPFRLIDGNGKASLRQTNAIDRVVGRVTTYHAVTANPKKWRGRVDGRTLLILDEPHHMGANVADAKAGDDPRWTAAVRPMVEAAGRVVLMSGTLRRHDGRAIPFIPYDVDGKPIADIVYRRSDALAERAILPIDFVRMDGDVAWSRRGETIATTLFEAKHKQLADAVRTALSEEGFRNEWLFSALVDWQRYRETVYRSRAIVIVHRQEVARKVADAIRQAMKVDVTLAVSDAKGSQDRLRRFRDKKEGDVLVTVGMAYEGLDVPDCTHLVCMTNVTSEPWLEQAFARVTRFNSDAGRPWEEQRAAVYVLDHGKMRGFIESMKYEQDEAVRETGGGPTPPVHRGSSSYEAQLGDKGQARYSVSGLHYTDAENEAINRIDSEFKAISSVLVLPPKDKLAMAKQLGWYADTEAAE